MRVSELEERLIECGLSEKESAIYLVLALHGPLKASEVGKRVQISRMDAYNNLRALQQLGIVVATLEKPMRFRALPVGQALDLLIASKRAELERIEINKEILRERLRVVSTPESAAEPSFKIIADRRNVSANIRRMICEATREVLLGTTRHGLTRFHSLGILDEAVRASERGVQVRLLTMIESENIHHAESALEHFELRHAPGTSGEVAMIDGLQVLSSLSFDDAVASKGKDDIAIWTNSPDFVRAQRTFFANAWDGATRGAARVTEVKTGLIVEPMRIYLGQGSMYEKLKEILKERAVTARGRVIRLGVAPESVTPEGVLEQFGIRADEIMNAVGQRIGHEIANQIKAQDRQAFFEELRAAWERLGLGRMQVVDEENLIITVSDSFSCAGMPNIGRPLCTLDEGILEGVIQQKLGVTCVATERHCTGTGHEHCAYEVTFANPPAVDAVEAAQAGDAPLLRPRTRPS